jgi:uncharacterized repeat protein (TIGR02543 family)
LFLLSLTLTLGAFSGCGFLLTDESSSKSSIENSVDGTSSDKGSSEEEKKVFYSVIFKQEGENDIVKQVEEGKTLTDIPAPAQKTGYTTKWSVEDFSNITENLTITAVATANEYTITYDAGEGSVDTATQTVTYDAIPGVFAVPTREGYNFVCWTYEGKAVQATDVWKIAGNVTFVATWVEIEKRTVTFVQDGYEPIIIEVLDGETFNGALIPETQAKVGYTVVWEEKIPSQITENIVINAVATPNTYTISYDAGEGTVTPATQDVVYDSMPETFAVPTRDGYKFKGWEYEGKVLSAGEIWTIAENVTLTAKWARVCTITLNVNGGTLEQTTITVVVGEAYALPTPTKTDNSFVGWMNDTTKVALSGTWTMDVAELTLTAEWEEDGWTKNY